jgi:ubiquinone/menaquinone biosynthesis C-methylase UbiE
MDSPHEAEAYARADFAEVNQAFVERLLDLAGHLKSVQALDLGTGPADIPARIVRACPGWHVVALDASRPMLDYARKTIREAGLSDAITLVLADAKCTGLALELFDVIFSNSILHHITDITRFWAEVKRLAKPEATVLVRDLARPASPQAARRIVNRYAEHESELLRDEYYRSLLSAYTPEEIRVQLDCAGLSMLEVEMVSDRHMDIFGRLP